MLFRGLCSASYSHINPYKPHASYSLVSTLHIRSPIKYFTMPRQSLLLSLHYYTCVHRCVVSVCSGVAQSLLVFYMFAPSVNNSFVPAFVHIYVCIWLNVSWPVSPGVPRSICVCMYTFSIVLVFPGLAHSI